jgi:YfiH family protein
VSPAGVSTFSWGATDGVVWLETQLPGARVAFSTRLGGVSEQPYDSLNLGILTDDFRERVIENRAILARALGRDPDSVAMGRQVHGAGVQLHDIPPPDAAPVPSDAQATGSPDVTPLVLVADCLPLAVCAPGGVAMVHCGWRGIVAGVVPAAVEAVRGLAGASPEQVHAALGPGIRGCCYEVGAEVRAEFKRRGHTGALNEAGMLDLATAVRGELDRCGVEEGRFADCGLCTSCDGDRFFSHRRDGGVTGRQAGLAWLSS